MSEPPTLAELRALADELLPEGPVPVRIEMSPHLWERVKTTASIPPPSWEPSVWQAGLSVVLNPDLAAGEWRLVDSNGDETERGAIE